MSFLPAKTATTTLLVFTFLLVSVLGMFCLGTSTGSDMDRGEMNHCTPLATPNAWCGVGDVTHLALWQEILTAFPQQDASLLLILVLALAAGTVYRFFCNIKERHAVLGVVGILRICAHWHVASFRDKFSQALARGIMHPRLFSYGTI